MPIGGSVLYSGTSFSKNFDTPATKGTVHFEANYTATTAGSQTWKIVDSNGIVIFGSTNAGEDNGNATKDWGFCNGESLGTNWFRQARGGHNRVVLDINLASKVVSYTVLVSSGNNSYSTLTGTYNLPAAVTDVKGLTATKQSYYSYMDNVSFYNVYDDAVSEAAYTINYQLSGTTVASETGAGTVGSTVNAQASIWNEGNTQKYFVADGATTSFTIADGTNEFNVAVREAETWTYYVKAFEGSTELMTISTNTVVEGETASYGYPKYIAVEGVLYVSSAQSSSPWWGESYTITENNAVRGFQYAKEGNESIVFCSEAEDIDGLTVVSGGNTDIRASNRKGAYATQETTITTLEPGIYRVFGATYGNAGTTFTLKAGDATVFTVTTTGNPVHTTGDYFLITETTDLVMPAAGNGGNSPKMMDYIIVQRAGEYYETMSIVGDFSEGAWDATQGIEMTRDEENPLVWTAVVNDYVITSDKLSYDYKAVANGNWDDYVLPSDENQNYNFNYDGAGAGTYRLTFTVNTQEHSVELAILKMDENTYTVAGSEEIFGSAWDTANTDNDMTRNSDNSFTLTKSNVVLAKGTYEYKVVQNHGWDVAYPESNAQIEIKDAGTYDITITYLNGEVSHALAVQKTITAAGYATYCSSYDLDFSEVEGLTAYYASKDESNIISFQTINDAKAETGLLLKGAAGTYSIPVKESSTTIEGNVLVGVLVDTPVAAGSFVLMNGSAGVGFYNAKNAFTVGANTAYIPASVAEARSFIGFDFDNTTTAIEGVATVKTDNGEVYNLQGQRVVKAQKGLYIINGKKVVIK